MRKSLHSINRVNMGVLESQLSAKFLPISQLSVTFEKSQLMFFPQFIFLKFFVLKNVKPINELL